MMVTRVIPIQTGIWNSPRESGDLVVDSSAIEEQGPVWSPAYAGKISEFQLPQV